MLKELAKGIVAFPGVPVCLADANVIKSLQQRVSVTRTERRTLIPYKIYFSGGNS